MENNYLLKHRQQQREREVPGMDRWTNTLGGGSTVNRYDYYGGRGHARYDDYAAGMSTGGRPMVMSGRKPTAIPSRLSRVRSEEMLGTRSEPDLRPLAITEDDENCRLFVALFDYDHLMSPNPNAQQEELSFRKHQLIKVGTSFLKGKHFLISIFRFMVTLMRMVFIAVKLGADLVWCHLIWLLKLQRMI